MTEAEFEQCINRICRGDKTGLKDIYEEYLPYLYRTVLSIVRNKEDAEDITSEFFVKLWSLATKYQPGNGHKGYLATIARNMAIDYIRKHQREIPMENPELYLYGTSSGGGGDPGGEPLDGGQSAQETEREQKTGARKAAGMPAEPDRNTPEEQVVEQLSIQEALERLKPEERQIIDMKVLGEMTFKEIAELLGIPMGTVTWRYQEGIKRLRRYGYE